MAEVDIETGQIDVWGDGQQTRSFCMLTNVSKGHYMSWVEKTGPYNGTDQMVTINQLVGMVAEIANRKIKINNMHNLKASGA